MGLLTKFTTAFTRTPRDRGGKAGGSRSAKTASGRPAADQAAPLRQRVGAPAANPAATATLETKPTGESGAGPDRNGTATAVVTRPIEPSPTTPRNKQELLEELQRNYREVVELIRKVDTHLDRDDARGQEFLSIARRMDDSLPAIKKAPEELSLTINALSDRLTQAIGSASSADEKRFERVESSLTRITSALEQHGAAQAELTTVMANFRETLNDIAVASKRTGAVLETIEKSSSEREMRTAKLLQSSRNWLLASLAVSVCVATAALAIAVVSMVGG